MLKSDVSFTRQDVARAENILQNIAYRSPVFTSSIVNEETKGKVFFKCENFQLSGSFKFRGYYYAIERLDETQKRLGVVVASSGNEARAVALSAKMLGVRAIVLASNDTTEERLAASREWGAEIMTYTKNIESEEKILSDLVEKFGWTLMPAHDYRDVVVGYATMIKELIEDVGQLDYLFVGIACGALISACALAMPYYSPDCLVIGVQSQDQDTRTPILPSVRSYVRDIVVVTQNEVRVQMQFFAEQMKMVVEPIASFGAAAMRNKRIDLVGKRVGVIVSGGNVDLETFSWRCCATRV